MVRSLSSRCGIDNRGSWSLGAISLVARRPRGRPARVFSGLPRPPPAAPALTPRPAPAQSIMQYNGGCCIAMAGKDCFAIASDRRFGQQQMTVSCDFSKCFQINDGLFIGMSGLATDIQTLDERFRFKTKMYELREGRRMKPTTFANVVASTLYEKRFGPYFVEPVVVGFQDGKVYLCSTDLIGAKDEPDDFIVTGTCYESLLGMAESLWKPGLEKDELFEVVSQTLLSAVDRDCLSGWGAVVHIVTKDEIITRTIKGRMD